MARPKGTKNGIVEQEIEKPRCPDCGSTDAVTLQTNVQEYAGETAEGKPFNRIVKRRTQCQHCSRVWIVRSLEFVPEECDETKTAE